VRSRELPLYGYGSGFVFNEIRFVDSTPGTSGTFVVESETSGSSDEEANETAGSVSRPTTPDSDTAGFKTPKQPYRLLTDRPEEDIPIAGIIRQCGLQFINKYILGLMTIKIKFN